MVAAAGTAFRQVVLKVHSRCNLACDHCYVYERADQSWRSRPVVMRDETIVSVADRLGEHCRIHGLTTVHVIFHGGEPLLAGKHRLRSIIRRLRSAVPTGCTLQLGIQTNGVLLDEEWCELFTTERVRVGISLDGGEAANDRHRRFAGGRSSYTAVIEAVRLINQPRFRPAFAGLLCTIDPMNDPLEVYDALAALNPPAIDFLLPHATWDEPPARATPESTPFADWLLAIHGRWRAQGSPMPIRTFDAIGRLAAGDTSLVESLGLDDTDLLVVETDGTIEQVDSLKVAYDGAPATGLNVRDHSFADAAAHPGVRARQGGIDALCATCRECPVVQVCGGGLYTHRYRTGSGFENPSVYCADLYRLVDHVAARPAVPVAPRPAATHALTDEQFDDLARGGGDASAIETLRAAERSLRRAQVASCVARLSDVSPAGGEIGAAWETLCELDERAPAAVDRVLSHPYVGVWAERATGDRASVAYLWAAAVAAAHLAGVAVRAKVPIANGLLTLPTLGAVHPGEGAGAGLVVVETDPATATVSVDARVVAPAGAPQVGWLPARRIDLGEATLVLDDLDPFRDCFDRAASPRLDAAAFERWRVAGDLAGAAIAEHFGRHRPAISRGLTTMTPLDAAVAQASATHRRAFGAIGVAATSDPAQLADALVLALVHEVQHLKMGAVLDLFELFDPRDERRFRVGWRDDARPIEGVLQGAYAHLAVVEVWNQRRDHGSDDREATAASAFAMLRDQTRDAIDTLLGSGSLTALGRRWVEQMRAGVCTTSS